MAIRYFTAVFGLWRLLLIGSNNYFINIIYYINDLFAGIFLFMVFLLLSALLSSKQNSNMIIIQKLPG
jgi:hypothetical protein